MKKVAVVGFGNIGCGVCRLLTDDFEKIRRSAPDFGGLKYICDLRSFPDSEYGDKHIKDFSVICEDPEVAAVIEVTGARRAAYEMSKKALNSGKSVITTNKEVVAEFGEELLKIADENGVSYLFEGAVGGTIPIIRPIRDSMAADDITAIYGILNGTTNYILTEMSRNGTSYEDALQNAQRLGYAEPDPSADVSGKDAARKIAILAACAAGTIISPDDISTEGITKITIEDIFEAEKYDNGKIKLIAYFIKDENGLTVGVKPCFIPEDSILYGIEGVNNGILVRCKNSGDLLFAGKGAGAIPTAAAVVSDVIEVINGKYRNFKWEKGRGAKGECSQSVFAVFASKEDPGFRESYTLTRERLESLALRGIKPVSVYDIIK